MKEVKVNKRMMVYTKGLYMREEVCPLSSLICPNDDFLGIAKA